MKRFEKYHLDAFTFLAIFGQKMNCIIFQYGFVYNQTLKKKGGSFLNSN